MPVIDIKPINIIIPLNIEIKLRGENDQYKKRPEKSVPNVRQIGSSEEDKTST